VTLRSISDGLSELQSPESQQVFASNPQLLDRLISRQINDLDNAIQGIDFALQNRESLEAIRAVATVATLGTGATLLGRVLISACAANPSGCTTFANEATVAVAEAATGVPYSGVAVPVVGATALGARLADLASTTTDVAAVVREVRLVQMEAVVASEAAQLASGQPLTRYMGVDIPANLPAPVAGWQYAPDLVSGARTEPAAFAHMTGFQGEVRVAADAANRGEVVVQWGDRVGTHGADVISVNPRNGEVILYDAKTYSNPTNVRPSATFAAGREPLAAALRNAEDAIRASNLPPELERTALRNIQNGNFTTRTTNQGIGGSSPVAVRYCGNEPCP
jgi:filamentous hemagglutinin